MPRIKYREADRSAEGALTLTLPEAARLLGISPLMARQAALRGDIPYIKIGRLYRVPKAKLMAMVNGKPSDA
jgi:excisionase family DNA binding protein